MTLRHNSLAPAVELNPRVDEGDTPERPVIRYRRRILTWPNPVEYVNNMYGCHPGDDQTDYFDEVFGK